MICDAKLKNRVKRALGQMQGVLNMMDEGLPCEDILIQLKAIRNGLDTAMGHLTTQHLLQRIEEKHNVSLSDLDDAIALIVKGL